jgi:hypothetical protein
VEPSGVAFSSFPLPLLISQPLTPFIFHQHCHMPKRKKRENDSGDSEVKRQNISTAEAINNHSPLNQLPTTQTNALPSPPSTVCPLLLAITHDLIIKIISYQFYVINIFIIFLLILNFMRYPTSHTLINCEKFTQVSTNISRLPPLYLSIIYIYDQQATGFQ